MPVSFNIVIPARFASTRLPGKPLRRIAGRTMIARVWDLAMEAGADEVIVATDDARIVEEIEGCGGMAMLTSTTHLSGTDRLAEVAERQGWSDDVLVLNLQGDEPVMPTGLLARVADALQRHPNAGIATLAAPITSPEELFSDSAVKVVIDKTGLASYFSRAPIPWVRGEFQPTTLPAKLPQTPRFLRHIGLYAYRTGVLKQLSQSAPSEYECAESLEQLRALAMGIRIHVGVVDQAPPPGVDTEADLLHVQRFFADTSPVQK